MNDKLTVVIHEDTCEVFSASSATYSFIGERFYHTFDHLVYADDLERFRAEICACHKEMFPVRLLRSDGTPTLFLANARRSARKGAVVVDFIDAETLKAVVDRQEHSLEMKNYILSIYDDEYFEYDAQTDIVRLYRAGKYERTVSQIPLDVFFDGMRQRASDSDRHIVDQFCTDLRNHVSTLYLRVDGSLEDRGSAVLTIIKGISVFEQGVYKGAAGLIHFGTKRGGMPRPRGRDLLTNVLQKSDITSMAISMIDVQKLHNTTLAIVDVDHFKRVNDTYGHMRGDVVLKRIAAILLDEVGEDGMVGRIGGDEFLIIYFNVSDMEDHREKLRSIKSRVESVFSPGNEQGAVVTLSIGCASYPKDADCYEDVFRLADYAMYRAKQNGRNRYVIFDQAKHGAPESLLKGQMTAGRLNSRGDMSVGDILCSLMVPIFSGHMPSVERLLEDAVVELGLQRVMLYAGEPWQCVCMAGEKRPDADVLQRTIGYLDAPALQEMYDEHGVMVLDDVERIAAKSYDFYPLMKRQGILSCVQFKGRDADGNRFLLSIESVNRRVTWNPQYVFYYRLFQRMLAEFHLL